MDIVIGFDIGGTNSRATIARMEDGTLIPHPDFPAPISQQVASKKELRAFIHGLLDRLIPSTTDTSPDNQQQPKEFGGTDRLASVVIALAGPVIRHREVIITNWPEPKGITLDEFIEWGMPMDRTVMINDMEAGCYGLMKSLREGGTDAMGFEPLMGCATSYHAVSGGNPVKGNRIFIAPGTGLGAAGIIEMEKTPATSPLVYPIATELQNTPMPVLRTEHRIVVDWLRREKQIAHPSWDDIVSGRGLVDIYYALRDSAPGNAPDTVSEDGDPAAAIARAGVIGHDPIARQALSFFYDCTGRFCQLMALGFQAFGGVFIGGASTIKNRDFIRHSQLPDAFLDNPVQQSLLARFPIHLVTKTDLNLDGALWLGGSMLRTGRFL
uniref:Glucokinase n=1 Tax=Candidatus Kentrum sp. FM TaxID=2126340 RepID=A0A450S1D3_9GAMM|nr:MAG: Glucokinase [Candidatus Kentron sp. FM]VFJ49054.1 MAG: Glucokinase [Candidatus Kentron sp. FM]VFK06759.1 MAG: Glucokinase [Candidatus Kentron sp. FM]